MDAVDATFKTLGLHYRETSEGTIYVDIPYAPETMPNASCTIASSENDKSGTLNPATGVAQLGDT